MDDNTTLDLDDLLQSPKPSSQHPPPSTAQDKTLEEVLAQSSVDLIRTFAASINQDAIKEASKSEEFRQEFKRRLFRAVMRAYVWSTARTAQETDLAESRLSKGVQELLSADREQGRSSLPDRLRVRLSELMATVSKAVEEFGLFC